MTTCVSMDAFTPKRRWVLGLASLHLKTSEIVFHTQDATFQHFTISRSVWKGLYAISQAGAKKSLSAGAMNVALSRGGWAKLCLGFNFETFIAMGKNMPKAPSTQDAKQEVKQTRTRNVHYWQQNCSHRMRDAMCNATLRQMGPGPICSRLACCVDGTSVYETGFCDKRLLASLCLLFFFC